MLLRAAAAFIASPAVAAAATSDADVRACCASFTASALPAWAQKRSTSPNVVASVCPSFAAPARSLVISFIPRAALVLLIVFIAASSCSGVIRAAACGPAPRPPCAGCAGAAPLLEPVVAVVVAPLLVVCVGVDLLAHAAVRTSAATTAEDKYRIVVPPRRGDRARRAGSRCSAIRLMHFAHRRRAPGNRKPHLDTQSGYQVRCVDRGRVSVAHSFNCSQGLVLIRR